MKILLQSTLFYPSVGGIETVSQCLAERYTELGHSCTVLTRSAGGEDKLFPFVIARNPDTAEKKKLIQNHDVVHCNGASLELVFWARYYKKPIVWTHAGYQLVSIDGLGWHEGEASPLSPFASFLFHGRRQGWAKGLTEYAKLLVRRFAAHFISRHVAITHWVAQRQPYKNQEVIYNPFPISRFAKPVFVPENEEAFDFFFLGRLVSEKGVATLLKAFSQVLKQNPSYKGRLLLIGDGNWRPALEKLAESLLIGPRVVFAGRQTDDALLQWVSKGKVAIIPSDWEEPMGGVAIEMLAAGKPVVVSKNGGLAECVGPAGLTFPNGDHQALAHQMRRLLEEPGLAAQLQQAAPAQLQQFDELRLTQHYISLFEKLR